MSDKVTVDITTGVGTLCFPHLFESTKTKNDKGEDVYDVQIIIPREQRDDLKAILAAITKVGEAKWGDRWKSVRQPLRNGDKEANNIGEDGKTVGEKYPERLGAYFLNARSKQPVGVVDRKRVPITNAADVYGGCKGRISVTFYPYSTNGNTGIGCALNGVQKVADGEPFGGGKPSVESMFDMLDEDDFADEIGEDETEAETPAPAKKAAAKKATAKKTAAKKAAAVVEIEDEDLDGIEEGDEDLLDDLDDLDD